MSGENKTARVRLTGDLLLSYLFQNLYNRSDIERVPAIIDIFDRGQASAMEEEIEHLVSVWIERPDWGEAMALTIECAEEMPFSDPVAALESYRRYPLLRSFAESPRPFSECSAWPVPAADPKVKLPVESSVPALVLAGTFDPVTPPEYGRQTAAALSNSRFFEFSGVGHDVLGNEPCAGRLAAIFLDDPTGTPNDPCLLSQKPPSFLPPND